MTSVRKTSGSSLVVVISVLATLMVIVAVAAEYTWTVNRHVQRSNTNGNAIVIADSCLEILFANWRAICRNAPTTPQPTSAFTSIALPTAAQLNLPAATNFVKRGTNINPNVDELDSNYVISNYKVVAVNAQWNALANASSTPEPELGLAQTGKISTTACNYDYIASADVTLPALGPNNKVVAKIRRVFQKQQLSPWNFAIFYVDPLEIHPGPDFVVTGWVHTNSDLYTGHNTLTFADKVTYGSDWYAPTAAHPNAGFKPGDGQHPETPTAPHYPSNLPPAHDDAKQPFGLDSTQLFGSDSNPNNDSYRELIEQATAGSTDPFIDPSTGKSQRYYDQAAIKILIDGSNNVVIRKANGTQVTSSSGGHDKELYNAITDALTTNQSIQDNREGASVRLATLDIGKIEHALNNSGSKSIDSSLWNGIIYIADTSGTSTTHRGIRLINGEVLPNNGLTIATPNPLYIQGDYNTGPGMVPSNSIVNNDPTTPQSTGYTRQPAAVLTDAVTILSNSWLDALAGTVPVASNTTVNTAIIAGIVPTAPVGGDGTYSGGAENFPRFLENWSSKKFTYYGSMVELYQSKQSIGKWGKANVYSPPDRQWYFDNNFKLSPPPGSIMVYSYVKGKWSSL